MLLETAMKNAFIRISMIMAALSIFGDGAAAAEMTAGVAAIDITPPLGYRMSGYFNERLSTGVLNPLQAKAIVLRQGGESAAMD